MLNMKEKSYETHKINSMTSLGKISHKNRIPPFVHWNSQSTPIHPEKKLKSSTHQTAINFDHDPRFRDRDHISSYNLSPVPSKLFIPIDPNYVSNFPSVDESLKILETNTKTQKKKPFKNKQNEENYMSDVIYLGQKLKLKKQITMKFLKPILTHIQNQFQTQNFDEF